MITVNPRLALLLSLLPLVLGRLRLVAAVAGGAWLVGIELSPAARVGLLLVAVLVIALDVLLTPAYAPAAPTTSTGVGPRMSGAAR
ncbi:hypothetical protein [Streptomyces sp. 11-1-2]|uniref:hypothetical protein n=1 Tax=Streptomyces sp. 11-1-2 TaxID=1851167 RepID=UPI000B8D4E8C|nr:hypothetical protein [Streptomyces sp. 11-1-2]ASR00816.1 hypothetical protein CGL27_49045 [Streptomyces sp. 11-1-2]